MPHGEEAVSSKKFDATVPTPRRRRIEMGTVAEIANGVPLVSASEMIRLNNWHREGFMRELIGCASIEEEMASLKRSKKAKALKKKHEAAASSRGKRAAQLLIQSVRRDLPRQPREKSRQK